MPGTNKRSKHPPRTSYLVIHFSGVTSPHPPAVGSAGWQEGCIPVKFRGSFRSMYLSTVIYKKGLAISG